MAGSTGKMTREAIKARGPRMGLYKIFSPKRDSFMLIILRFGSSPFTDRNASILQCNMIILARSYSLPYLMSIAKGCKQ